MTADVTAGGVESFPRRQRDPRRLLIEDFLGREERYTQQQRLRTAIAHHGRQHHEEQEARREQLTKGGEIL
ncbi:DUF2526 family protein [Klebsiella aerogenes]|uniref:DUF2526 family protein n=1 Tax=Klebsiella aerogenes TaxID=548 RepID=UPI0009D66E2C